MDLILAGTSVITTVTVVKLSISTCDYGINPISSSFENKTKTKTPKLKRNIDNFNIINKNFCAFINNI